MNIYIITINNEIYKFASLKDAYKIYDRLLLNGEAVDIFRL